MDAMVEAGDPFCNTLWIWVDNSDAKCIALIYAGVFPDGSAGCLHFHNVDSNCFSRGADKDGDPIRFENYGKPHYFPANSVIDIKKLKSVLATAYRTDFGS
ncbi:hypothetical protein, partial [Nocardia arizonensis]|uniref:hypothetical protein n=1 Tax=Nocardia arizonensis TaxID=1141647 RepID=UPI001951F281